MPLTDDPLELRKKLDRHHSKVSQLDVSFPINRWECIDFIRRGIIFAGLLGVPCVDTTDGKYKVPGMSDKEQIDRIVYHLSQCLPVAENQKVIINVEPHGPFTTNPEYLLQIVEHFQSPWVKINFDTGNSFNAGQDPPMFLQQVTKYVTHVHCKDVSPALAAAMRGKETGISASVRRTSRSASRSLRRASGTRCSASRATARRTLSTPSPGAADAGREVARGPRARFCTVIQRSWNRRP